MEAESELELDPQTVCVRTFAGEAEAKIATWGLSLMQRRILVLLDRPRTLAAFAARYKLTPYRVERDLANLADLGLIALLSQEQLRELVPEKRVAAGGCR